MGFIVRGSVLFLIFWMFFLFSSCSRKSAVPSAVQGLMNLEKWDFVQFGNLELNGQWEFYYQQFLSSEDIAEGRGHLTGYINFPGTWRNFQAGDSKISGHGYGTFRLRIRLPNHPHISMKTATVGTSYKMFLNGKEVLGGGQIGQTEEKTVPGFHFTVLPVYPDSRSEAEIILQIANFSDPNGGLWESMTVGDTASVLISRKFQFMMDIFLFSTLMVMGIYHITLFLLRRKDLSPLYFGIFCMMIGLRTLLTSERILHNDVAIFSWDFLFSAEYLTYYVSVPLFSGFIYSLYKEEFSLRIAQVIFGVSTVFILLVIFTKVKLFTEINVIFQIFTLLTVVYMFFALLKALFRKREDIIFFFLGMLFIVFSVVHDILVASHILHTVYIFGYGLAAFILFQSTIIASRFSRAFLKSEELTESLIITNYSIARFVPSEFLRLLNRNNIVDVRLGDHLKQEMTVFFSDIRGFTSLAEKLNSEDVFKFLNTYFSQTISIISRNHGFVDKIIGDGIMAIFPSSPNDAVQASMEIMEAISEWNRLRKKEGLLPVTAGIGIHTGTVSMGTVGTEDRLDTTVIGDTVNIASRLENLNKDYRTKVILSETVYSGLDEKWMKYIRELDNTQIRGREKNLTIFECFAGADTDTVSKIMKAGSLYKEALLCFKQKNFTEAKRLFSKCRDIHPEDSVVQQYIQRCSV